jgi:hypothetical protein
MQLDRCELLKTGKTGEPAVFARAIFFFFFQLKISKRRHFVFLFKKIEETKEIK